MTSTIWVLSRIARGHTIVAGAFTTVSSLIDHLLDLSEQHRLEWQSVGRNSRYWESTSDDGNYTLERCDVR